MYHENHNVHFDPDLLSKSVGGSLLVIRLTILHGLRSQGARFTSVSEANMFRTI